MIKYVEKRYSDIKNPNIVEFDIDKIKIAIGKAFKELNMYDEDIVNKLANKVKYRLNKLNKETVNVEEIQDIVEKVLIKENYPEVAKAYILYRYERNRIRDSKNRLMRNIKEITFSDAKNSDIKRENGNIDGNTSMGTMLQYGSAISKEFSLKFVMNPEHAYAHENGLIHIHDLDFLSIGTTTCSQIDLNKLFKRGFSTGHGFIREPQDIMSYSALTAVIIQANQNDQHGGQSIPAFDYFLAEGVLKTYRRLFSENLLKFAEIKLGIEIKEDDYKYLLKLIKEQLEKFTTSIEISDDKNYKEKKIIVGSLFSEYFSVILEDKEEDRILQYVHNKTLKETERRTYQAMEALIHNLNTLHSRAGAQVPFSSINFGTDTSPEGRMVSKNLLLAHEAGLGNGETPIFPILIFKVKKGINYYETDPNYDLFKLAIRVSAKRLFPNFAFIDAPFNLQYYKEGRPETEAVYMGCRTRVIADVLGDNITFGRGNISFTTINLVRLGIKYGIVLGEREKADMEGFYKELEQLMDLVKNQLLERFEIQARKKAKNFPFVIMQGVWNGGEKLNPNDEVREIIKHGTLSIGFIGLAETLIALTGKHHGESEEAQKLGLEIICFMRNKVDEYSKKYNMNFTLLATPAEGLSGRFVKIDRKIYGEIKGVTDKEYYTNSFHVPVYYKISAKRKIDIEAPYHALTNAGHITYIELDGDVTNNLDAFETIIKYMCEKGIGYGSINHPVDHDPVCGYNGIINDTCPKCGRKEEDIPFNRIRRITGYLVGTLDKFNNAKKAEEKDRIKHNI